MENKDIDFSELIGLKLKDIAGENNTFIFEKEDGSLVGFRVNNLLESTLKFGEYTDTYTLEELDFKIVPK